MISFKWFPGFSLSQKQKSIDSLHRSAHKQLGDKAILEISSKSTERLGIDLSAFNLTIRTLKLGREFSVESAFQASKVFDGGGPFTDLLDKTSREAKTDPRLRSSGSLVKFRFFGEDWSLEPKTAFYDWLYIKALMKHSILMDEIVLFDAFTDIEFNPEKSINCQARAAALFVSFVKRGILHDAMLSKETYLNAIQDDRKYLNSPKQSELIWSTRHPSRRVA